MKTMNFKTVAARTVAAGCLLGLTMAAQSALACTVGNWSDNSGNVAAGGPDTSVARYSGLCAMGTPASEAAWVQDNSPGGINRIRARFYVLNNLDAGQSAQIYRGFDSVGGGSPLFTVFINAPGTVTLIDNATATQVQQTSSTTWTSVEIDWSQGSGNGVISLSVNGEAPQVISNLGNTGNALQSVRLGNLNGAAGSLNFDAYESRRTTEIGRMLACDAQPDDSVDVLDALAVINEINEVGLATGQPDCDENGAVDILDVLDIVNIINT